MRRGARRLRLPQENVTPSSSSLSNTTSQQGCTLRNQVQRSRGHNPRLDLTGGDSGSQLKYLLGFWRNLKQRVRPGAPPRPHPPSRRRRSLHPFGPFSRPPQSRGGLGCGADSGPGGNTGAALTGLAASGAGRQQGAAQTESRDDQQQPPGPHCPEARRGSGTRPRLRAARAPCALPPAADSSRRPRSTCGPAERSLAAHRRRTLASPRGLACLLACPVAL